MLRAPLRRGAPLRFQSPTITYDSDVSEGRHGRVCLFDCRPFKHALRVKRSSFRRQNVVLLFDLIVTTTRHMHPLLSGQSVRRPLFDASHRVPVRRVAVSFDRDVKTCGQAVGKLLSKHHFSGKRGLHGNAVGAGASGA